MQTLRASWPGGSDIEVALAKRFVDRWRGLRPRHRGRSILLRRCSVHGWGMREPLTIIGVDRHGTVVGVRLLRPGRVTSIRGAEFVIETPLDVPPPSKGTTIRLSRPGQMRV